MTAVAVHSGPVETRPPLSWRSGVAIAIVGALVGAISLVGPPGRTNAPTPVAELTAPAVDLPAEISGIDAPTSVIVRAVPGRAAEAAALLTELGGQIVTKLPIVDGFEAVATGDQLHALRDAGLVVAVALNEEVTFQTFNGDADDVNSAFVRSTGAETAWDAGNYGAGIGVAVIDTGVSPMADFEGRLVHGPDLSGEGTIIDSYGHGTVMAGAIAGNGTDSDSWFTDGYTGVAPEATIVAVKTAGRNGAADVSTVLQAMHWVSAYANQFNIRVLNISWGSPSQQDPQVDPLNYAVQRLWQQGIVVVAAIGNDGPDGGTVMKPGDDPAIITVGAYRDKHDLNTSNDSLADWSSRGPTAAGVTKPDLIAPGHTIISARSFGSEVSDDNVHAHFAPSYIRGSGTSQATAVTSGLVALLLAEHPDWTPDQVKAALKATAMPFNGRSANDQGAGRVQLDDALVVDPGPAQWQTTTATGLGSLEASRGGRNVETDCDEDGEIDVITGEITARCETWDPEAWTGGAWTGGAWTGGAWTGAAWTGGAWTGGAWTEASWTGGAWTGGAWTGGAWTGGAWTGGAWTGGAWTGGAWTGAAWTGDGWSGGAWTSAGLAVEEEIIGLLDILTAVAFWGDAPPWWNPLPGEPLLSIPPLP